MHVQAAAQLRTLLAADDQVECLAAINRLLAGPPITAALLSSTSLGLLVAQVKRNKSWQSGTRDAARTLIKKWKADVSTEMCSSSATAVTAAPKESVAHSPPPLPKQAAVRAAPRRLTEAKLPVLARPQQAEAASDRIRACGNTTLERAPNVDPNKRVKSAVDMLDPGTDRSTAEEASLQEEGQPPRLFDLCAKMIRKHGQYSSPSLPMTVLVTVPRMSIDELGLLQFIPTVLIDQCKLLSACSESVLKLVDSRYPQLHATAAIEQMWKVQCIRRRLELPPDAEDHSMTPWRDRHEEHDKQQRHKLQKVKAQLSQMHAYDRKTKKSKEIRKVIVRNVQGSGQGSTAVRMPRPGERRAPTRPFVAPGARPSGRVVKRKHRY